MSGSRRKSRLLVSKQDYAAYRGCSPAYVSKLIRQGKLAAPALLPDGKVNIALADRMLGPAATQLEPQAQPSGAEAPTGYAQHRAEREEAEAALKKLELERQRGRLMERAEVAAVLGPKVRELRDELLRVPTDLIEDPVLASAVEEGLTKALSSFSTRLAALARGPSAA